MDELPTVEWTDLQFACTDEFFIGKGATSVVFRGALRGQPVAIKLISSGNVASVIQELNVLQSIKHERLVATWGLCKNVPAKEGGLGIVMQLCWMDLAKLLTPRDRKHAPQQILTIALDVAEGMRFCHSRGLVHRDLKPQNIGIVQASPPRFHRAMILDFGIAQFLQSDKTVMTGNAMGSPAYSAPELLKGESARKSVDVFSFGVMLWEMVEQREPWHGLSPFQILSQIVMGVGLSAPRNCTPSMASLIMQCLNNDQAKRLTFDIIHEVIRGWMVDEAPPEFYCCISLELMRDPHVAADGFTYEKASLEFWLKNSNMSPVLGLPLAHKHLTPNVSLRNLINDWQARRASPEQHREQIAAAPQALPAAPAPASAPLPAPAAPSATAARVRVRSPAAAAAATATAPAPAVAPPAAPTADASAHSGSVDWRGRRPCKFLLSKGYCKSGQACNFMHDGVVPQSTAGAAGAAVAAVAAAGRPAEKMAVAAPVAAPASASASAPVDARSRYEEQMALLKAARARKEQEMQDAAFARALQDSFNQAHAPTPVPAPAPAPARARVPALSPSAATSVLRAALFPAVSQPAQAPAPVPASAPAHTPAPPNRSSQKSSTNHLTKVGGWLSSLASVQVSSATVRSSQYLVRQAELEARKRDRFVAEQEAQARKEAEALLRKERYELAQLRAEHDRDVERLRADKQKYKEALREQQAQLQSVSAPSATRAASSPRSVGESLLLLLGHREDEDLVALGDLLRKATAHDVNYYHQDDARTPLSEACLRRRPASVRLLLQHGATVNLRTSGKMTPIMIAASLNDTESLHELLSASSEGPSAMILRVDGVGKDPLGNTALHLAITKGAEPAGVVALMLQHPQAHDLVTAVNNAGESALLLSIGKGFKHVVALLLERWAEEQVNLQSNDFFTPLMRAVKKNDEETVRALLQVPGIFVNAGFPARLVTCGTPLVHAISSPKANLAIVKMLCNHTGPPPTDFSKTNDLGETVSFCAARSKDRAILEFILKHPNNLDNGVTMLHTKPYSLFEFCVDRKLGLDVIRLALQLQNFDPNSSGTQNQPLIWALEFKEAPGPPMDIVQALLLHPNIDPNKQKWSSKQSPFAVAALLGNTQACQWIADHAKFSFLAVVPNTHAISFAVNAGLALGTNRENVSMEVLDVLLRHPLAASFINEKDGKGNTSLIACLEEDDESRRNEVMDRLLRHEAIKINAWGGAGDVTCPLMKAIERALLEPFRRIVARPEARLSARNSKGWLPLHCACAGTHPLSATILQELMAARSGEILEVSKITSAPLFVFLIVFPLLHYTFYHSLNSFFFLYIYSISLLISSQPPYPPPPPHPEQDLNDCMTDSEEQLTPLIIACMTVTPPGASGLMVLRALLSAKLFLHLDSTDKTGSGALHWAIRTNQLAKSKLLLSAGANPNLANNAGRSCTHEAATLGDLAFFQMLADVPGCVIDDSVLLAAMSHRRPAVVSWLLHRKNLLGLGASTYNFDFNAVDGDGNSLLLLAAKALNKDPPRGCLPDVHAAACEESLAICRYLLNLKPLERLDINLQNKNGTTVLMLACLYSYELLCLLTQRQHILMGILSGGYIDIPAQHKLDWTLADSLGETCLHKAARGGDPAVVDLLCNFGQDVDVVDDAGVSSSKNVKCVDRHAQDLKGRVATSYAKNGPTAEALNRYGVSVKAGLGENTILLQLKLPKAVKPIKRTVEDKLNRKLAAVGKRARDELLLRQQLAMERQQVEEG